MLLTQFLSNSNSPGVDFCNGDLESAGGDGDLVARNNQLLLNFGLGEVAGRMVGEVASRRVGESDAQEEVVVVVVG